MLAASAALVCARAAQVCDIYAGSGTPCVAAHSTVRALYAAYNGPLYQVWLCATAHLYALAHRLLDLLTSATATMVAQVNVLIS